MHGQLLMQNIVIDKPYRFVAPYPGKFWERLFQYWLPHYLKKNWGIARSEVRGADRLQRSLAARHGIVLAPNHSRPCDPMVMGLLAGAVNQPLFIMASWHLFMQGRFKAWLMRRLGAFSVYREGMDREALKAATTILASAQRPLVLFPEGVVSRTNDQLGILQEGTTFMARTAARQRAKATPPGNVVIHPVAIKYFFEGDLEKSAGAVLDAIESRLGWQPRSGQSVMDRIARLGEALLSLKEIEYFGKSQPGTIQDRLAALIERVLGPAEAEWLSGRRDPSVIERVKKLRTAIVPDLVTGQITEEERGRRWRQLADCYLAQQLACYPPDYLRERVTPERLLETVERFEEDLTDVARIHRPMRVVLAVGEAIEVPPGRDRSAAADPLLCQLSEKLQALLDELLSDAARKRVDFPNASTKRR